MSALTEATDRVDAYAIKGVGPDTVALLHLLAAICRVENPEERALLADHIDRRAQEVQQT